MAQMTVTVDPTEIHAVLDAPWDAGDDAAIATDALARVAAFPVPEPIRVAFWQWYDEHSEDVILKKRLLFWNVELRVKHLKSVLFERFFGQHP